VTAWICCGPITGLDLIIALKERDIMCPRNISGTGFDGILRPPGATLRLKPCAFPYYEIGFAGSRPSLRQD